MYVAPLFVMLVAATLSSVPTAAAISRYEVVSHAMCRGVSSYACQGKTDSFLATDARANIWFQVKMGETGVIRASVKWYYQSGSLEESGDWDPTDVRQGSTWYFWWWISIRDYREDLRGFWRAEVYIEQQLAFTEHFTIGPYYQITAYAAGVPETVNVPIKIDGEDYGDIRGAMLLGFKPGTSHDLSVQQEIVSDGFRWTTHEGTWRFDGEGSHSFVYEEQYQLSIEMDPAGAVTVPAAGWYSRGDVVEIGQIPEIVDGDSGIRYVRMAILLDDQQISSLPGTITMDKPHSIVIKYQTQYYLKVASDYGNPQGEGWHDAGSQVAFSVTTPSPQAGILGLLGGTMIFQMWTGDATGTTPSMSIRMEGPKTVIAEWNPDNTMLYVAIGTITIAAIVIAFVALLMMRRRVPVAGPVYQTPPTTTLPQPSPSLSRSGVPVVKFCTICGTPLTTVAKFCNKCGSRQ